MNQVQGTPVGVSAGRLTLAYKELFPKEFDLKNLPDVEQTFANWLERFNESPEKAIATQNWAGKATQALFHALGIEQPKTKRDMLAVLKKPPLAVRIVEYTLDYVHRVQVAVPSCSDEDAIAKAEEAFDSATIWDDTPAMPLLYDDYEEMEGNFLHFKVVSTVPAMKDLPEPDASAKTAHKREAARSVCGMLISAYQAAKDAGKDSISIADLEAVVETAIEAESGYREPLKVLVEVEGGACIGAYANRPVEVVVMDADKVRRGGEGNVVRKISFPDGIEARTVLSRQEVDVQPDFVREVFETKEAP